MSVPKCDCRIKYDLADSVFPAKIIRCALHEAAPELFEIVDGLVGLTAQVPAHTKSCHCFSCRAIRALYKARGLKAPEMGPSLVKKEGA